MIRTYCDDCKKEIIEEENRVSQRLKKQKDDFQVEVMVAYKGIRNAGAICQDCLLDVIINGEEVQGEI